MHVQLGNMQEWLKIGSHSVCVRDLKDSTVYDDGILEPQHVRSFRVLVSYENHSNEVVSVGLRQWSLFDSEGFAYEFELRNQFYQDFYSDDAPRKLKEGEIMPGQKIQGWVAFQPAIDAKVTHVTFRPTFTSNHMANIKLS